MRPRLFQWRPQLISATDFFARTYACLSSQAAISVPQMARTAIKGKPVVSGSLKPFAPGGYLSRRRDVIEGLLHVRYYFAPGRTCASRDASKGRIQPLTIVCVRGNVAVACRLEHTSPQLSSWSPSDAEALRGIRTPGRAPTRPRLRRKIARTCARESPTAPSSFATR